MSPELVYSKGGVPAFVHPEEALLGVRAGFPFPAWLLPKLVTSRQIRAFELEDRARLESALGYYCGLQSLNSEDSVTWAVFGTLGLCEPSTAAQWFRCLLSEASGETMQRSASPACFAPWQRIPHPQTHGWGGPEIDFYFADSTTCCLLEAKWRSDMDEEQGKGRDVSQLEMRLKAIPHLRRLSSPQDYVILMVTLPPSQAKYEVLREWFEVDAAGKFIPRAETTRKAQNCGARILCVSWDEVLDFMERNGHPFGQEVPTYLGFRLRDYRERYCGE